MRSLTSASLPLVLAAAPFFVEEPQQWKPPAEWTQEEALAVLSRSPWAREVRLYQRSGRLLGVLPGGRKVVYQDAPNRPPRQYSVQPVTVEPELVKAVYGIRWSSARTVQQALKRLEKLSPVLKGMQAPAPELSAEHYVLTARVVEPPEETVTERLARPVVLDEAGRPLPDDPPRVPDIFAGFSDEELRERAELRTNRKLRVKPERVLRHGVGTSEGVSFYFPRRHDGRAVLPPGTKWVELTFQSEKGDKLKARFKLADMVAGDQPDY